MVIPTKTVAKDISLFYTQYDHSMRRLVREWLPHYVQIPLTLPQSSATLPRPLLGELQSTPDLQLLYQMADRQILGGRANVTPLKPPPPYHHLVEASTDAQSALESLQGSEAVAAILMERAVESKQYALCAKAAVVLEDAVMRVVPTPGTPRGAWCEPTLI